MVDLLNIAKLSSRKSAVKTKFRNLAPNNRTLNNHTTIIITAANVIVAARKTEYNNIIPSIFRPMSITSHEQLQFGDFFLSVFVCVCIYIYIIQSIWKILGRHSI